MVPPDPAHSHHSRPLCYIASGEGTLILLVTLIPFTTAMGPTAAILLPSNTETPAPESLLSIARMLEPTATSHVEFRVTTTQGIGGSGNTRGEPRAFGIQTGDPRIDDEDLRNLENALNFRPAAAIHVFAYSNSPVDHRIVAELTLYLLRRFGGVVDFGGDLGEIVARKGWLAAIAYHGAVREATFHVSDAEFLESWLGRSEFHMVK